MNYFDYVPDGSKHMGSVWGLFGSMSAEEINRNSYEYSLNIVNAALNGNIVVGEDEEFSLKGYTYGCRRNEKLSRKSGMKELHIVDSFTEDENEKVGFGDISERVLGELDTMLDEFLDDESFEQSIESLLGLRNEYLVRQGIDIVELVKNSLKNVQASVKLLSSLSRKDSRLRAILEGLLGTGHGSEVLGRLSVVGG